MNGPARGRCWLPTVLTLVLLASSAVAPFRSVEQGRLFLVGARHHAAHHSVPHIRGLLAVGPVLGFRALVGVRPQGDDVFVPPTPRVVGLLSAFPARHPLRQARLVPTPQSPPLRC